VIRASAVYPYLNLVRRSPFHATALLRDPHYWGADQSSPTSEIAVTIPVPNPADANERGSAETLDSPAILTPADGPDALPKLRVAGSNPVARSGKPLLSQPHTAAEGVSLFPSRDPPRVVARRAGTRHAARPTGS